MDLHEPSSDAEAGPERQISNEHDPFSDEDDHPVTKNKQKQELKDEVPAAKKPKMSTAVTLSLVSYGSDDEDDDDSPRQSDDRDEIPNLAPNSTDAGPKKKTSILGISHVENEDAFDEAVQMDIENEHYPNQDDNMKHNTSGGSGDYMTSFLNETTGLGGGAADKSVLSAMLNAVAARTGDTGDSQIPPTIMSESYIESNPPVDNTNVVATENSSSTVTADRSIDTTASHNENELNAQPQETLTQRLMREIKMPPEPTGSCEPKIIERVENACRRMRIDIGYDPNRGIQDKKEFRNPSIYDKLISFLNIDEKGTNFAQDIYNPYKWEARSFYDELSKVQNKEMEQLERARKEQRKAEQASSNKSSGDIASKTAEVVAGGGALSRSTTAQSIFSNTGASTGNVAKSASGTNLTSSLANATFTNSLATGYVEPKKKSKWDLEAPSSLSVESGDTISSAAVGTFAPNLIGNVVQTATTAQQ